MKSCIRTLWICLGVILAVAPVSATLQRGGPSVTAQLGTGVVKLGDVLTCAVQVEGARRATIEEIPEIPGLKRERTSGPSLNESTRFINGRVSSSRTLSWVITFRPEKTGDFVIPPMRLNVDGKSLFTRELTLSVVEDMTGQELGYFEFVERPAQVYEGQPFTLRMNLGWDAKLDSMVNVANLILPWWNELPGALEVESGAEALGSRLVEVHVNSRIRVRAVDLGNMEVRDTPFRVLQLTRSYVATRSGSLEFPQSWLEFGQVRRRAFSENRETYFVGVPAFSLEVKTLPERGRPPEFSGGVGSFEVQADVNRRDLDLGESVKLTVDWTGAANLEFFELPNPARIEAFKDFRVYGTTNERFYGDRRRVVYDLAPKTSEVLEVPPLPLVVFDPELEEYRTISSRPIPLRVRALEGVTELSEEGERGGGAFAARDIQARPGKRSEGEGLGAGVIAAAWLGIPLFWLLGRGVVRRRGDPNAPASRRRRAARRRLARELRGATTAGGQSRALCDFLGARSCEEPEAWEGRDLRAWFESSGLSIDSEAIDELVSVGEELDRRRWAGDDSVLENGRLRSLADTLSRGGF
jgi:hypothetical protein